MEDDLAKMNAKKHKPKASDAAPPPLEGVRATNAEKKARTRKQKRALAAKMEDDPKVRGDGRWRNMQSLT